MTAEAYRPMDEHSQLGLVPAEARRVLAIDDDPVSLRLLAVMLSREGYRVECRSSGVAAVELLRSEGAEAFAAVVTDYQMPGFNGSAVLDAVRELDPSLATVVITGAGERGIVSASLRAGAVEFLDKPFEAEGVARVVQVAVNETGRRRTLRAGSARLQQIAQLQHRMIPRLHIMTDQFPRIVSRFYPIDEAGGDFVTVSAVAPGRVLIGLGDVSGHGVKEGFLAAHLQGIVKGMALSGVPAGAMVEAINQFLCREWAVDQGDELPTSLCAVLVTIDLTRGEAEVVNCGCPSPVFGGALGTVLPSCGAPLGWFVHTDSGTTRVAIQPEGCCYLWSDGLEAHASELGVGPLALAYRIIGAGDTVLADTILAQRRDDIVACRIDWRPHDATARSAWYPFFSESYPGDAAEQIDVLQTTWERALRFAIPRSGDEGNREILLCAREAVLNAMKHGCSGHRDRSCQIVLEAEAGESRLRVTVKDGGSGFTPPVSAPDSPGDHVSLGLEVIRSIAQSVSHRSGGSLIEMVFETR